MASDALYLALAQSLGQPSRAYRAANAGLEGVEKGIKGYEYGSDIRARRIKEKSDLADNYSKLFDVAGPDIANKVYAPMFEKEGLELPNTSTPSNNPQDLASAVDQMSKNPGSYSQKQIDRLSKEANVVGGFMTPDEARAQGVDESVIGQYHGRSIPRSVSSMNLNKQVQDDRNNVRKTQVELSAMKTAMQYGGAGAAQSAIKDSVQRNTNIARARGILAQIQAQGGKASKIQRAQLSVETAKVINPTGFLTNEALDQFLPKTAVGKYGNVLEYWRNAPEDVDFSEYANRFQDLLNKEQDINSTVITSAKNLSGPFSRFMSPGSQASVNTALDTGLSGNHSVAQPKAPAGPKQTPQDALQWVASNQNDPRAKAVLAKAQRELAKGTR